MYRKRENNPLRIKWKYRTDFLKGRYFYFSYLLGLYFVGGGISGYYNKKNLFCLIISVVLGVVILFLAIAHTIDYYGGASIEAAYTSFPFIISLLSGIFLTVIYFLGTRFTFAIYVSIPLWIGVIFYGYALVKDHGDGKYYRENTFVPTDKDEHNSLLTNSTNNTTTSNTTNIKESRDWETRFSHFLQRVKSAR